MSNSIRFNKTLGKWEGLVNGKVVITSKNEGRVRYVLKSQHGVVVKAQEVVEVEQAEVNKPTVEINKRFAFTKHFVQMVARGKATSLVISGPGGLGKTFTVMQTLIDMGLVEDTIGSHGKTDYVTVKGFTTAKGLYRTLFENNGKIIIFDDADSSFKDPVGCNVLKGALDSGEKRIISWNAESRSERDDLPSRFEFVGRVIFISNLPMNKIPQAVISRALRVSLDMTMDEKIDRLQTVMMEDNFMPMLTMRVKKDVLAFMRDIKDQFTDLNIRTAIQICQIRDGVDDDQTFREMAQYLATS